MSMEEVKAQSVNPLPGSMTTAILSTRHWRQCRQETILDTERSVPNFALGLVVLILRNGRQKAGWQGPLNGEVEDLRPLRAQCFLWQGFDGCWLPECRTLIIIPDESRGLLQNSSGAFSSNLVGSGYIGEPWGRWG